MPSPALQFRSTDEFPADAARWPRELSRREFLQLSAATLALAGLAGCARRGPKEIVARATAGDETQAFATVMPWEGYGRGILVTTHGARPTKIEGNPDHPESLGATDVFTQAAILGLYDPDRSRTPQRDGLPATWRAFEGALRELRQELLARRGKGLALLTEPTTSPTLRREMHRVLDAFPEARWFQHTALGRHDHAGAETDFDFSRAEVILTVQADCFYRHPAAVRYGRAFADRRRVERGRVQPPRFHALEPTPSVTGALADFRLPASPAETRRILDTIAHALASEARVSGDEFVDRFVADTRAHRGRVVCVAGPECDPDVRTWVDVFNARFGTDVSRRRAPVRSDGDPRSAGELAALGTALARDEIDTLFVLGANPIYTAPADLEFPRQLSRARLVVHLGEYADETAASAHWHLPESHFLESWSDLRGYDGTASIQQPLVAPLHDSRSALEVLHLLAAGENAVAYELVRETWRRAFASEDFDEDWHRWLDRGIVHEPPADAPAPPPPPREFPTLAAPADADVITAVFQPDPNVLDGRFANHPWLQELPKPLSHLVWENAALVSPAFAARHALADGDVIACEIESTNLIAPVWIQPGQADRTIALSLGYGRTRAGRVGNDRGYDAYRLRVSATPWARGNVTLRKLGRVQPLVSTQGHFAMEGRDPVRVVSPAHAAQRASEESPATSLYPAWPSDRYAWGMAIDLGACLGCNACIIACQAENNIPSVGREQVARGREMHWLRVDRYVAGEAANPQFLAQPVPCMHCEHAPCELVCPVGATVHSSEGLNDMVYNRCIGTRYCSNNCPYKVRRFNFLDYRAPRESPLYAQANPEVTVRERGVMEKCTYCVQRIDAARIAADREGRAIHDGEVRTACQQVCPADAIAFGNLNDRASRVAQRKAEATSYALLAELNTRPRTTYLAAIRHDGAS